MPSISRRYRADVRDVVQCAVDVVEPLGGCDFENLDLTWATSPHLTNGWDRILDLTNGSATRHT